MPTIARPSTLSLGLVLLVALLVLLGDGTNQGVLGQLARRPGLNPTRRGSEKPSVLKDAFFEDNSYVVRIRTIYNNTMSITCNAVLMEDQLVLSDVTCIKYQGMANIDARYVHVVAGEFGNETEYEVDQIYINKADPRDPGTELALLKLARPIRVESQCRQLLKPEKNYSIESDTSVRVIGYTTNFELKENRTRVARRTTGGKYICTQPADLNETPGYQLLKGAPLLHMVDCKQHQLVGILTKTDTVIESNPNVKKHQDCYVMVSSQIKWYDQVKSLASLGAKNGGDSQKSSAPIMVEVTDD